MAIIESFFSRNGYHLSAKLTVAEYTSLDQTGSDAYLIALLKQSTPDISDKDIFNNPLYLTIQFGHTVFQLLLSQTVTTDISK